MQVEGRETSEPEYPRSTFKQLIESEGEIIGLESAWVKRDGTTLFVRESARAIRDENGPGYPEEVLLLEHYNVGLDMSQDNIATNH